MSAEKIGRKTHLRPISIFHLRRRGRGRWIVESRQCLALEFHIGIQFIINVPPDGVVGHPLADKQFTDPLIHDILSEEDPEFSASARCVFRHAVLVIPRFDSSCKMAKTVSPLRRFLLDILPSKTLRAWRYKAVCSHLCSWPMSGNESRSCPFSLECRKTLLGRGHVHLTKVTISPHKRQGIFGNFPLRVYRLAVGSVAGNKRHIFLFSDGSRLVNSA